MPKNALIRSIVAVILKYCRPTRIYLYGSQANGEAGLQSDIDIAFDDPECSDEEKIREEIEALPTLLKIDVKNLAHTGKRFQNRVRSTGKVLYSSNKRLRAEDGLYNFDSALSRLHEAVACRKELEKEGFGDLYLDLLVKRFEFTYEMAWKALKRYLDYLGLSVKSPRAAIKEGFAQGLIEDEELWLEMIEQRNLSAHIYDEMEMLPLIERVEAYLQAFDELRKLLNAELQK